ncbi:NAD(P)H-flavin reductase [Pseudidiomarina terrestris]|uniref:NAD(P)H-flavin reductase n=1 Tax=Pseudidiomarina terrestris TaxID=2820060 RepID=A0ABT8MHZ2_9GAMM|nr:MULTISPECIES: NAD(P)H-flavin reductase [unclassified Pseudidiomarina]MDN7129564.1 NAD(P)H-flavin reductase [Pseudidiomarina sp. 1APR75-15]MDN7135879.1 NAD(P)H-flavin reductase [Pseudidiomarina sp. 1ASP75-5]
MKQMLAQVTSLETLSKNVYQVVLALPEAMTFAAGQYLQVVMDERDKRPFSIASCPSSTTTVELHIGAMPDNPYAMEVIEAIRNNGELTIEAPLGQASYRANSDRAMILIAGGTGFSYTWSILQAHLRDDTQRPVTLYWGGRAPADLYYDARLRELSKQHKNFHYRPVVEQANANWHGAIGLVHHAVLAEQTDLNEADVYVAGRFEMVRIIRDEFHAQGLPLQQLYGDALAFI